MEGRQVRERLGTPLDRPGSDVGDQAGDRVAYSCTYGGAHDPDTGVQVRSGGLLDLAVEGQAYMVWEDALPSAPTSGPDPVLAVDGWRLTWSTPMVISQTPAGVDAFIPTSRSMPATPWGSYYDFRNNHLAVRRPPICGWSAVRSGCTSPANWTETRVTPGSFDMHQAPVAVGEFVGDHQGITTNGDPFEPFFIQSVTAPTNPRTRTSPPFGEGLSDQGP